MESPALAPATADFRVRGAMLVVVGLAFAAVDATSEGGGREFRDVLIGGGVFGALTGWATWRSVGEAFDRARPAGDAQLERAVATWSRAFAHVLLLAVVFVAVDVLFRHTGSDAGFPIGAGLALIWIAARVGEWESKKRARLLRALRPGYSLNLSWKAMDASAFRIARTD